MNATTNQAEPSQDPGQVSPDEVAQRAYQLWEAAGRPSGQDLEHWLQAEAELLADARKRPTEVGAAEASPKPGIADAPPPSMPEAQTPKLERRKMASSRSGSPGAAHRAVPTASNEAGAGFRIGKGGSLRAPWP
jgi:hypothetical protein